MPRKPKPFPVSDEARAYLDAARAYVDRAEEHAASSEQMEEVRTQAARRWFTETSHRSNMSRTENIFPPRLAPSVSEALFAFDTYIDAAAEACYRYVRIVLADNTPAFRGREPGTKNFSSLLTRIGKELDHAARGRVQLLRVVSPDPRIEVASDQVGSLPRVVDVRRFGERGFVVDRLDPDTPPIPTIEQIEDGLRRFPDVRERIDEVLRDFKREKSALVDSYLERFDAVLEDFAAVPHDVAFLYDLSNSRDEIC